jgi:peptide/nickel transport system substrate-binding protein
MKKWLGYAVIAGLACMQLSAPAMAQKKGGILQFALVAEPPNYDCHSQISFAVVHPVAPHYSTLLKYDAKSYPNIVGDLADSWKIAPDGLSYEFKIHKGVKFHDGSPLTSADIKASYERIANPPEGIVSARKAVYEDIGSIETPDEYTVIFRMKTPNASMLDNFASPYNCIYSAAKLKQNPRYPETEVMGTGAFAFVENVRGSHWTGKRFDGYFRPGRPYLDGFKIYFVKSTAVVAGMQGGQFDAEFRTRTPGERDQLLASDKDRWTVHEGPWVGQMSLVFNVTKKPFDDIRVRHALSMAVDRWGGSPALRKITSVSDVGGTIRPGYKYALPEDELVKLPGFGKDIEKSRAEARRLLKEAGVENLKLKLLNRAVGHPFTPLGVYVVDQFRRIGVAAEHSQIESKAYFAALASGEFEVAVFPPADAADDPNAQFTWVLSTKSSDVNGAHHSDMKIDELFTKQSRELDPVKRKVLVNELDRYIIQQSYNVPIIWYHRIIVHHKRIKGWYMTPSHLLGQDLVDVWLDPDA